MNHVITDKRHVDRWQPVIPRVSPKQGKQEQRNRPSDTYERTQKDCLTASRSRRSLPSAKAGRDIRLSRGPQPSLLLECTGAGSLRGCYANRLKFVSFIIFALGTVSEFCWTRTCRNRACGLCYEWLDRSGNRLSTNNALVSTMSV